MSVISSLLCLIAAAQFPLQFEIRGDRPELFVHAGHRTLVFEVFITNWDQAVLIDGLTVGPSPRGPAYRTYSADDVLPLLPGWAKEIKHGPVKIGSGLTSSVYLWVDVPDGAPVTKSLVASFSLKTETASSDQSVSWTSPPIDADPAVVIGPPAIGERWVALNGPSNTTGHRRAQMILDGGFHFAQRFAIDFLQVDSTGQTHSGDELKNESYFCYGKPALAVADGTVVLTHDGVPNNVPGKTPPVDLGTLAGNHVGIQIGPNRYAMYAHLIPGSLKVKVGEHVKRGQAIGLIGNSGNSSEPHLHFQVVDAPSFFASDGVPFAFDKFFLHDAVGIGPVSTSGKEVTGDTLIENQVVDFSVDGR